MYESFFGFSSPPFQLNPDPAFYFNSRGHGRALAYLQYGVTQGEGFIVITGEIGAGKTTLVRMLLDGLDRQKVLPAQIVSTQLESGELLQSIITAFGIPAQGNTSKAHLIATLEAFLTALAAQGRHALLIVDEAQNLEPRAVEELRMLSNFQLGNRALLQSFLVGQPELRRLLESPSMEQLRQRVTASCHLGPLGLEETQAYVEHRLRCVGWTTRPSFAPGAFQHLYRWSGGVPRRLNRLANRLLLAAFLDGTDVVTPELVERTAGELRAEIGEHDFEPVAVPGLDVEPPVPAPAPVVAAAPAPEPAPAPAVVVPLPVTPAPTPAVPVLQFVDPPATPSVPAPVPVPAPVSEPTPVATEPAEALAPAAAVVPTDLSAIELDARSQAELDAPPQPRRVDVPAARQQVLTSAVKAARQNAAGRLARRPSRDVVLCLADSTEAALKFAVLAEALADLGRSPRMVLVSLGPLPTVWPWAGMGRLLPAIEVGLDLEWVPGDLEGSVAALSEGFGQVVEEFKPMAVLTLGASDAVTACCLAAHQRGLPLMRLEAGERRSAATSTWNATLIEQMADVLFVPSQPSPLSQLRRQGLLPERIFCVPDRLAHDAVLSVWSEVITPDRAFLRNGLPMYLGPAWSAHDVPGTPYALVAASLLGLTEDAAHRLVEALAQVACDGKVVWLLDAPSLARLEAFVAADAALSEAVCVVRGDGVRHPAMRERVDAAKVLCRDVASLPEQISLLRGASAAVLQAEHALIEAATLLGVPHALLDAVAGRLRPAGAAGAREGQPLDGGALNQCLLDELQFGPLAEARAATDTTPTGAAAAIAEHLQHWIDARLNAIALPGVSAGAATAADVASAAS